LFNATDRNDGIALAMERREQAALQEYEKWMSGMPVSRIHLQAGNVVGIERLRRLLNEPDTQQILAETDKTVSASGISAGTLTGLVDELAKAGKGVIMTMGKGGVGKTTIAAAIAGELARRGFTVHLNTTDPAAHVQAVAATNLPSLHVSRIDPVVETSAYTAEVLATAGKDLDINGRALLEEDLRSPCTEEIAVFRAFARTVADGENGFVVLDTAPTGHTLLLLDATEAYHKEVLRHSSDMPEEVRELLPRLRNGGFTKVLIVTLPEATPVHEAAYLQEDLRRAGIEPFAWVINQSFADSGSRDLLLAARGRNELPHIREVTEKLSKRLVMVPWVPEEPVGFELLGKLFNPVGP